MSFGGDVSSKKRKVVYDEHTGGFYKESRVEALQRQTDYRSRLTDVINKSEEAKYRLAVKQVDAERQIFLMKKEKEASRHSDSLLDHKAYRHVLEKLAKERESLDDSSDGDIYGRYPPGATRPNLDPLVESELKDMSPIARRRREATRLLTMRTDLTIVDRAMSTDELFGSLRERKSRVPSPVKTAPVRKSVPKLVLPAISVKMTKSGDKTKVSDSVSEARRSGQTQLPTDTGKKTKPADVFPSVFVTQTGGKATSSHQR